LATAEGGTQYWTGTKTLEMRCFDNYNIIPGEDFVAEIYYWKGMPGSIEDYVFPEFTTDHKLCFVNSYQLDTDSINVSVITPAGVQWSSTCLQSPCRTIQVLSDTLKTYNIFILVNSDGPKWQYFPIKVHIVCGFETISLTQPFLDTVFARNMAAMPPDYIVLFSSQIRAIFQTDKPQCDIVQFNIFYDKAMTLPMTADPDITLVYGATPSSTKLQIKSGAALHSTVWLQGITDGGKFQVLELNFTVCGFENLWAYETKRKDHFYWYNLSNPIQSFEWPTLGALFGWEKTVKSSDLCFIPTLELYTDVALTSPWVFNPLNPTIQLETFANGT
jgi:hypothetical protein